MLCPVRRGGQLGDGGGTVNEENRGDVPLHRLHASLEDELTEYDRRLYAMAEELVEQAMASQPAWMKSSLSEAQRDEIRENLFVHLMVDERGLAMLEDLIDGPRVAQSDEVDRVTGVPVGAGMTEAIEKLVAVGGAGGGGDNGAGSEGGGGSPRG
ncbi:MAG: hypothetical protein AAGA56_26130 [Myxococcota bacterium]